MKAIKLNSKKRLLVISGSRADYSLLKNLILKFQKSDLIEFYFAVTGGHLSTLTGMTISEIRADKINIDYQVDLDIVSDNSTAFPQYLSKAIEGFTALLSDLKPQAILVLGDRYEVFGAACASLFLRIPIVHIHGGEVTRGAYDESLRHCITKLSHLHFTSSSVYRKRVIQLGESPKNVFNVGSLGVESLNSMKLLTRAEIEKSLELKFAEKNFLITFHPETLSEGEPSDQLKELLNALDKIKDATLIFTAPGIDSKFKNFLEAIKIFIRNDKKNRYFFNSLGQLFYFSIIKNVDAVIGNSSSGILEVPSLKVATINIGDRQEGREKSSSVIDCNADEYSILRALEQLDSTEFKKKILSSVNVHDKKGTADAIVKIIENTEFRYSSKNFYDLS